MLLAIQPYPIKKRGKNGLKLREKRGEEVNLKFIAKTMIRNRFGILLPLSCYIRFNR